MIIMVEPLTDIITKEERDEEQSELMFALDLDAADSSGEEVIALNVPVVYIGGCLGKDDGYRCARNQYRLFMENERKLLAVKDSFLREHLQRCPEDAVEYLVAEGDERASHPEWGGKNEAVLIGNWLFPTNVFDRAAVHKTFMFKTVKIELRRSQENVCTLTYKVDGHEIRYQNP